MTNSRSDVQRQFELLFDRISQVKHAFESCPSYDSSSNDTGSEYDTDDALETNITEETSPGTNENTDRQAPGQEQPQGIERKNDELTWLPETAQEMENGEYNKENGFVELYHSAESEKADIPDERERYFEHGANEDTVGLCDFPALSETGTDLKAADKLNLNHPLHITHEIPNTNEHTPHSAYVSQIETHDESKIQEAFGEENYRNAEKMVGCTYFWRSNIKPRRPLHENSVPPTLTTEEYEYDYFTNENDNGLTESVNSIITQSQSTEHDNDIGDISDEVNNFNFISIEGGLVSFTVKSDWDCESMDTENEHNILHFEDGFVSFDVKYTGSSNAFASTCLEYSSDYDIFSDDEPIGIDALFDNELADSYSETDKLSVESEDSLDGLANLFDESAISDENEDSRTPELDHEETEYEDDQESESSEIHAKEFSGSPPSPSHSEARIECSFAGVVLLNALPRLLTSSLVSSFFSTPSLSFAFYKPVVIRGSSWLSASDLSKLSFSSQELPFNKVYGLTFPEAAESNFDTLSTTSKESSLESVCES